MAEDKEFLTIEEAADYLDVNRATVYNRMNLLGVKTHKFPGNRRAYLAMADVERMKQVEDAPWETGKNESKEVA